MAYAVRILRKQASFSFNDLNQLYSELSEKEKSLLLKRFPISRLYINGTLYRTCFYCSYWLDRSAVTCRCSNCSGNESRNSQCIRNHDKPIPPEVLDEMKLVIERNVFGKLIILESELSKPAAVVIVGEFKDKWYPIVAFGDEDYLKMAEQAIADLEKAKDDLPKNYYLWTSLMAITVLAAMIFMYGSLARVNKWWPFSGRTQEKTSSTALTNERVDGEFVWDLQYSYAFPYKETYQNPIDLDLRWHYVDDFGRKTALDDKFPRLMKAVIQADGYEIKKGEAGEHKRTVVIRCYLENGDIYEATPRASYRQKLVAIADNDWRKLPQY